MIKLVKLLLIFLFISSNSAQAMEYDIEKQEQVETEKNCIDWYFFCEKTNAESNCCEQNCAFAVLAGCLSCSGAKICQMLSFSKISDQEALWSKCSPSFSWCPACDEHYICNGMTGTQIDCLSTSCAYGSTAICVGATLCYACLLLKQEFKGNRCSWLKNKCPCLKKSYKYSKN